MLPLLFLALATPAGHSVAQLASGAFQVPPRDYRYVQVHVSNWPAAVNGSIEVSAHVPVQFELLNGRGLSNLVHRQPHEVLLGMRVEGRSTFRQQVPEKGDYTLLVINPGDQTASVDIEATEEFAREPDIAKYPGAARKLAVIILTFSLFLGAVAFSIWRLGGAIIGR